MQASKETNLFFFLLQPNFPMPETIMALEEKEVG